ncbi:hypothetical protein HHI36_005831 [Cryptolaemus montrouzieri]|uniref:Uncharacterized protein n=1 Tax=Cryptolaemus montrouzieri TaxID=559131 RepID=A0ABD2NWA3_9CUCU
MAPGEGNEDDDPTKNIVNYRELLEESRSKNRIRQQNNELLIEKIAFIQKTVVNKDKDYKGTKVKESDSILKKDVSNAPYTRDNAPAVIKEQRRNTVIFSFLMETFELHKSVGVQSEELYQTLCKPDAWPEGVVVSGGVFFQKSFSHISLCSKHIAETLHQEPLVRLGLQSKFSRQQILSEATNQLCILHQNTRSAGNALNKLELLVSNQGAGILAITEHWMTEEELNASPIGSFKHVTSFCREKVCINRSQCDVSIFLEKLGIILEKSFREKVKVMITEDFNIKTLLNSKERSDFLSVLAMYDVRLTIHQTTRPISGTCLNDMITNLEGAASSEPRASFTWRGGIRWSRCLRVLLYL